MSWAANITLANNFHRKCSVYSLAVITGNDCELGEFENQMQLAASLNFKFCVARRHYGVSCFTLKTAAVKYGSV